MNGRAPLMALPALAAASLSAVPAYAQPAANGTPQPPIIQAFETVCAGTATVRQAADRALAARWVEEAPAAGSPFAQLTGVMRDMGAGPAGRTFTAEVGGRRLHAWLRETIPAPIGTFVECKIYDFAPAEPLTIIEDARRWQGRADGAEIGPMGNGLHAIAWDDGRGNVVGAGIERSPCPAGGICPARIVVEQSMAKAE